MARVLIGNVKGPKGDAATVAVGTVTTGAAGSDASVTNSGTSSAAEFNFTIPKGAKGDAGTPGVTDYATASAAGLVRIGSDFNIDSNNGTISENNVFTQASSLAEINSGDSHATILGKLKKFMNTLMPSSFLVNAVNSTATDKALTANMGKAIADDVTKITGDIATVQTSATASRAYSVGEYLVLNGQLYIVTSAIANGGTIAVGTNVSATTAGAQLKSLNDSLVSLNSVVGKKASFSLTLPNITAGAKVTVQQNWSYASPFMINILENNQALPLIVANWWLSDNGTVLNMQVHNCATTNFSTKPVSFRVIY